MQNIDDLDVSGRRVLVRSDLNVPFDKSGSGTCCGVYGAITLGKGRLGFE